MDREKIVDFSLKYKSNLLSPKDTLTYLVDYLIEECGHEDINKIQQAIKAFGFWGMLDSCLKHVYNFYKRKYNINELYSSPDQMGRRLLINLY